MPDLSDVKLGLVLTAGASRRGLVTVWGRFWGARGVQDDGVWEDSHVSLSGVVVAEWQWGLRGCGVRGAEPGALPLAQPQLLWPAQAPRGRTSARCPALLARGAEGAQRGRGHGSQVSFLCIVCRKFSKSLFYFVVIQ